ncbi:MULTISPECIES: hypothetical protein [unclassified Streptococcus]|uniref:hypothetical protein n=1 Tax=unclassified Streptococcus TaxID=2608887 RepID=UPI0010727304|nr:MULTISPECIES: hypothetical protein [unclassified Streptococcus]MBF0786664.1 hypothetical protein [Streptococcus sp. 19428wC2_LYSM12]MCQ9211713.1 hypothetical protein [Streptococcus sp. B01]MCQ9213098.1 hypothetical protein [Streptococcus sp. O1]TFV06416.1 hypothetical protein E4T79_01825 [Streptococcus sp. LYSM12]
MKDANQLDTENKSVARCLFIDGGLQDLRQALLDALISPNMSKEELQQCQKDIDAFLKEREEHLKSR